MKKIIFLAGDRDFKPLVDEVVREGMFVELMYEKSSVRSELKNAADSRREIDPYMIQDLLYPEDKRKNLLPRKGSYHEILPNMKRIGTGYRKDGKEVLIYKKSEEYITLLRIQKEVQDMRF